MGSPLVHVYEATGHVELPALGLSVKPGDKVHCVVGSEKDRALRGRVNRGFAAPVVVASAADKEAAAEAEKALEQERQRAAAGVAAARAEAARVREKLAAAERERSALAEENARLRNRVADLAALSGEDAVGALREEVEGAVADAAKARAQAAAEVKARTAAEVGLADLRAELDRTQQELARVRAAADAAKAAPKADPPVRSARGRRHR